MENSPRRTSLVIYEHAAFSDWRGPLTTQTTRSLHQLLPLNLLSDTTHWETSAPGSALQPGLPPVRPPQPLQAQSHAGE